VSFVVSKKVRIAERKRGLLLSKVIYLLENVLVPNVFKGNVKLYLIF
jgi:hypothetical protein